MNRVLPKRGSPEEAIRYAETACRLAPEWPSPRRQLAFICVDLGRQKEAKEHLQKYLSLEQNPQVREATLQDDRARSLMEGGQRTSSPSEKGRD